LLINMSIPNVGTRDNLSKTTEPSCAKKFSLTPTDNCPEKTNSKTAKTDNTHPVSEQNEADKNQPQDFDSTFDEKIKTNTNNEAQAEKKTENKNKSNKTVSMVPSAQPFAVDELIVPSSVHGETGTTASLVSQVVKPVITEQVITKPLIAKPIITESVITKPVNTKPVIGKPVITDPVITSPVITEPDITKSEQITPENIGKIQPSDNEPVVNDKLTDSDKIATNSSEKMIIKDGPIITSQPKSNQQSGEESLPQIPVSNDKITTDNEQSIVTNQPSVPDSPKTQLSNDPAALGAQASNSQQKVLIGQESPAPAAEQTAPNKAGTDQKDHPGKTELFESTEKDNAPLENPSIKSIAQKMNQPAVQLSASQAQNRSNLPSNQISNPDMEQGEQVLVGGNAPEVTEQSPTLSASAPFAKTAGSADSADTVSSQIQESIHTSFHSGSRQIVVRLNPPELGKVAIKFVEQGDDITGLLQVDKPQTRDQLQQLLPEVIQNLQDSGIQIKRLEVVLTNQQEQYTSKEQSSTAGQDSFSGQQSSPNQESQANNTTYNQWLSNIDSASEFTESNLQFTENSINMLI